MRRLRVCGRGWFRPFAGVLAAVLPLQLMLHQLLGAGHLPVQVVFRPDNSASESASWKGPRVSALLRAFCMAEVSELTVLRTFRDMD